MDKQGPKDPTTEVLRQRKESKDAVLMPIQSVYEDEKLAQDELIRQMTVSQSEQMRQALTKFDKEHDTLIDYFAIIGFDSGQLRKVIAEILACQNERGSEYLDDANKIKQAVPKESTGQYRILRPSVLERFPQMDRHRSDFPAQLHSYFFNARETVLASRERMEADLAAWFKYAHGRNPDEGYQTHGYTDMQARHSYITTHIFYEDLADIQASLPPPDIYEHLMTKDDNDELIMEDNPLEITKVPMSNNQEFIYQNGSDSEDEEDQKSQQSSKAEYDSRYSKPSYPPCFIGRLPRGQFFVKKGFSLITRHIPACEQLNRINVYLRKACTNRLMQAQFEIYLARLVFQVPLPLRGHPTILQLYLPNTGPEHFTSKDEIVRFQMPGYRELPPVNHESIAQLFDILKVDNIMRVFKRILLETSNMFISVDRKKLYNCCEAFRSLIFPFKYQHVGNLFIPYLSQRDFGYADAPFPFMLGINACDQKNAKIKDGTYIIDLDKRGIWQQPHTSVILSTSGTTKDISIDDLPDLPQSLQSRLSDKLNEIQKKADGRMLTRHEVEKVRWHFFVFFCQMLKYFNKGLHETEWYNKSRNNQQRQFDPDPVKLFNYEEFLNHYAQGSDQDKESWSFLRYFTSMPLFKRLVQREVLEQDYKELHVFQHFLNLRMDERNERQSQRGSDRQDIPVYDCYPFFEIARGDDRDSTSGLFQQRDVQVSGFPKWGKMSQIYSYHTTPQFLAQDVMMELFNSELVQAAKLQEYYQKVGHSNQESCSCKVKMQAYRAVLSRREQLQIKFDVKSQQANVFMCWLLLWCGSFRYQEKNERDFLATQAIQVVKKMFYRVEQEVAEIIILMMHVAFTEGTEAIVRQFRELYLIDLKLLNNQAVEQFNLRALGRGHQMAESNPDILFQERAQSTQFSRVVESIRSQRSELLGEINFDEDARIQAIERKVGCQFDYNTQEDYQFSSAQDMINANKQDSETKEQQREDGKFKRFFRFLKDKVSSKPKDRGGANEESKQGGGKSSARQQPNRSQNGRAAVSASVSDFGYSQQKQKKAFGTGDKMQFSGVSVGSSDMDLHNRESSSNNPALRKSQSVALKQPPQQSTLTLQQMLQTSKSTVASTTQGGISTQVGGGHQSISNTSRSHFNKRTFFLPEEQADQDGNDNITITLSHTCPYPECMAQLDNNQILHSYDASPFKDETNLRQQRMHWKCMSCGGVINPTLQVQVGTNPNRVHEVVPLFHSFELRNLIEIYLQVDVNYRSVQQRNLDQLRENRNIFWNLIFYFSETNIPLELAVPYANKALGRHLTGMIELDSKQALQENVRRFGLHYLDVFVQIKSQRFTQEQRSSLAMTTRGRNAATSNSIVPSCDGNGGPNDDGNSSDQRKTVLSSQQEGLRGTGTSLHLQKTNSQQSSGGDNTSKRTRRVGRSKRQQMKGEKPVRRVKRNQSL